MAQGDMAGLRLSGVHKSFGAVEVLKDVNLEIAHGEFVVFVGPSGCGKSTLLRLIAGLEQPSSGGLEIGGRPANDVSPSERGVAMVFQSYALYPHMSVYENMAFALKLANTPKAEIDAAVRAAAAVLDLEGVLDRKPKALSGGQRQRAAIGRAIVRKPELFLFDEPLSNLDAGLRVKMRYELARLHGRLKTTMIYVTHDQVEAMTLADRIVVLSQGRVEQVGAPMEVYRRPENLFVAGFIGSPRMNLMPVELVEAGPAEAKVRLGPQVLTVAVDARGTAPGAKVTLGVRPEHFQAATGADAQSQTLTVRFVESLGSVLYAYGAAPGAQEDLVVQLPGDSSVTAGQALAVRIDPACAHLFDPAGRAYPRSPTAPAA